MTRIVSFRIIKNKANQQYNLTPKKKQLPKCLIKKLDSSKFIKIKKEDLFFD